MAPNGEASPRCPDWVCSNNSNVHVAKDREWFTDYTPFSTYLGHISGVARPLQVDGVGTVEIPLNAPHAAPGKITVEYKVTLTPNESGSSSGSIKDHNGQAVGYFDGSRSLWLLKLSGPPVGRRLIQNNGGPHLINALWPEAEAARWTKHQANLAASRVPLGGGYTAEEKKWLKENFKSEFHFLRDYGLNIYKDEEREEGRTILRAFMRNMADYHFTSDQLGFITKHYDDSMTFMHTHGLKSYGDHDCQEAKTIIRAIMKHERLRTSKKN